MGVLLKEVADPITHESAQIWKDGRGKLYMTGPLGVYKMQSNRGQKYLSQLLGSFPNEAANDGGSPAPTPSALETPAQRAKKAGVIRFSVFKKAKSCETK